jgi:hypothetical protein
MRSFNVTTFNYFSMQSQACLKASISKHHFIQMCMLSKLFQFQTSIGRVNAEDGAGRQSASIENTLRWKLFCMIGRSMLKMDPNFGPSATNERNSSHKRQLKPEETAVSKRTEVETKRDKSWRYVRKEGPSIPTCSILLVSWSIWYTHKISKGNDHENRN